MPKVKTNKAAAKRFKLTKSGLVKYAKAGRRHILTSKGQKRKRHLREGAYVALASESRTIKKMLPYL